jgi:hypothetical protein
VPCDDQNVRTPRRFPRRSSLTATSTSRQRPGLPASGLSRRATALLASRIRGAWPGSQIPWRAHPPRSAPTCAATLRATIAQPFDQVASRRRAAVPAAGRRTSTAPLTSSATPWNWPSASYASTAPWPPGSANATSSGAEPSTSPPSGSGSATHPVIYQTRASGAPPQPGRGVHRWLMSAEWAPAGDRR